MSRTAVSRVANLFLQSHRGFSQIALPSRAFASAAADTHDDFKPQPKAGVETKSDVNDQIKAAVESHKVFLYMKGHPGAPQCGFSMTACRVLDAYNVQFGSANILADPILREGIKKYTSWPTIPQVFVNGEFIGGSDILMSMHESGELEKLFEPIVKEQQAALAAAKQ